MTSEGMVHALQEARRVVCSATKHEPDEPPFNRGVLDVRPWPANPRISVRISGVKEIHCGPLTHTGTSVSQHSKAEHVMQRALREGWFNLRAERDFEWIDEYDTVDDLVTAVEEDWSSHKVDEDVALRLMQMMEDSPPFAQAVIRQRIGVRLLHKALG